MRWGAMFKFYSFIKGKTYTIIGFIIVAFSLKIMFDSKTINQDSIQLLLTGLMIAGFNHEGVKKIINSISRDDKPTEP